MMNPNPVRLAMLVLFVLASAPDDNKAETARSDAEAIKGQWLMSKAIVSGVPNLAQAGRIRYFFDTTAYIKSNNDQVLVEGEFTIDPTKTPKSIDLVSGPVESPLRWQGIYEIEGDVLRMAFSGQPHVRPASFERKHGASGHLFVLKRVQD
jgi:uncharacterized protein (TIGR03067 family)